MKTAKNLGEGEDKIGKIIILESLQIGSDSFFLLKKQHKTDKKHIDELAKEEYKWLFENINRYIENMICANK